MKQIKLVVTNSFKSMREKIYEISLTVYANIFLVSIRYSI